MVAGVCVHRGAKSGRRLSFLTALPDSQAAAALVAPTCGACSSAQPPTALPVRAG